MSGADFDQVAAELYAARPAEFVKQRDARARQAQAEGDADLARRLKKLRRPTQSAWLVNQLVRDHPDLVAGFVELGSSYREPGLTAARLRELSAERQRLISEIGKILRGIAAETLREIEATFTAVLADPQAEGTVRSGRLERPLSYAGFGATPLSLAPAPQEPAAPETGDTGELLASRRARAAAAKREFEEADRSWRDAAAERDEVRHELDRLRAQLRDAENRLAAAERGVRLAKKRRDRAEGNM